VDKTFHLEIITPDRAFFSGEAESVTVTTPRGEMGILPGAMPLVAALAPGALKILQNKKWMEAVAGEGFLEVTPRNVVLLAQSAEWPYEIQLKSVEDDISSLNEQLKKQQSLREYKMAKAQLARQLARLRIKKNVGD
jgi:F-type H+-transporting ATPase subunit epsilon